MENSGRKELNHSSVSTEKSGPFPLEKKELSNFWLLFEALRIQGQEKVDKSFLTDWEDLIKRAEEYENWQEFIAFNQDLLSKIFVLLDKRNYIRSKIGKARGYFLKTERSILGTMVLDIVLGIYGPRFNEAISLLEDQLVVVSRKMAELGIDSRKFNN